MTKNPQKRGTKMIVSSLKSSPYFQEYYPKIKAFQSLYFKEEKMPKKPKRAKTYGAILRIRVSGKEKYALVQGRHTGKWSFPKGHSDEGEEPMECTLREVAEETGIDELPEPVKYIQVGYGKYFIFHLTKYVPLIPRDTIEIMDTKWVTLDEMEKMSLNADARQFRKQLRDQLTEQNAN